RILLKQAAGGLGAKANARTLRDLRGLDKDPAEAVAGGLGAKANARTLRDLRGLDKDPAEAVAGGLGAKANAPSLTNLGYASSSVNSEDRKPSPENSELSPVTKQRIEKLGKDCHSAWPNSYIVGGQEVSRPFKYPFMGLMGIFREFGPKIRFHPMCGAVLLNKEFALTAAHCFQGKEQPSILRLREHDLKSDNDGSTPVDTTIEEVILHPEYKAPRQIHDIALVRLRDPVIFSATITPVCLPLVHYDYNGSRILAMGWGLVATGQLQIIPWGSPGTVVRRYFLRSQSQSSHMTSVKNYMIERCPANPPSLYSFQTILKDSYEDAKLPRNTTICAGEEGKDICQGDSGGPILYDTSVVEDGFRRYKLAGIVSLGVGCGDDRYPSIYTNVWPYLDWITETMALKGRFEA
ncbi:unnamed protein product, partial [Cyprideis torosa]